MPTLHHNSKRYEIQTYSQRDITWRPVAHSNEPQQVVAKVYHFTRKGQRVRVLDRDTRVVALSAKPCTNTKNHK